MSYVGLDSRSMVRGAAEIDMSWLKVISYISDQTFNPSLKVRLRTTKRHTRIFHLNLFQIDKPTRSEVNCKCKSGNSEMSVSLIFDYLLK